MTVRSPSAVVRAHTGRATTQRVARARAVGATPATRQRGARASGVRTHHRRAREREDSHHHHHFVAMGDDANRRRWIRRRRETWEPTARRQPVSNGTCHTPPLHRRRATRKSARRLHRRRATRKRATASLARAAARRNKGSKDDERARTKPTALALACACRLVDIASPAARRDAARRLRTIESRRTTTENDRITTHDD